MGRKLRFFVRKNDAQRRSTVRTQELTVRIPLHLLPSPEKLPVQIPLELLSPPESLLVQLPLSAYMSATVYNPRILRLRIVASSPLPPGWILAEENTCVHSDSQSPIVLYRPVESQMLVISTGTACSLSISTDLTWTVRVGSSAINCRHDLFCGYTTVITCLDQLIRLLSCIDNSTPCVGNPDTKFSALVQRHKGCFRSISGTIVAVFDTRPLPAPTIRHQECSLLIAKGSVRCAICTHYRHSLNAMLGRSKSTEDKVATTSHTNYRYLSTPEKHQRMALLHKENRVAGMKVKRMKEKLNQFLERSGVQLESSLSSDLCQIMDKEEQHALKGIQPGSFQHVFWEQQKEAATKDKRGMRWHPAMIKWCLFLRHQSSRAYETLRQSGCIHLPSQRTLRDYSQCVKSAAGFSAAVDSQLMQAASLHDCKAYEKLVVILIDEMYVREDLVFEKKSMKLVGFTNLGDVNDHLLAFERSIDDSLEDDVDTLAKTIMVFMVRGIFTKLRFPYAQFPCASVTGDLLYHPFWMAVLRLERMEFKVLAATFDGASVNRRLVKVHDLRAKLIYRVRNVHSMDNRYLYFFSDPPHLIKTTRNCWSSSVRSLWNNGQDIAWSHLVSLYHQDTGKGTGLAMVPKLKHEHIFLTSFSKMRVDLAAQVLSESVAKALPIVLGKTATETARFVETFDKFFDALNVSNFTSGIRSRKPFQRPYINSDDERIEWLEKTFLPYLSAWEKCVADRKEFSKVEKKRMLLSDETLLGLRMTANSFIDLVRYMFSLPEVRESRLAFLSQVLCQDPLEGFFGCQRQRGGTSDNPSVQEFFKNTAALRVVNSFCRNSVRGNCRGSNQGERSHSVLSQQELTPIPRATKRRRLYTQ